MRSVSTSEHSGVSHRRGGVAWKNTPPRVISMVVASFCFLAPLLLLPVVRAGQSRAWQPLGLRGETVLAVHVANYEGQPLIYAETHAGLWRFSPGTDWRRIDGPLPRSALGGPALAAWRVVPGRPRRVYALTGTGTARQLFRSDTGGDRWQIIGPAPGQTARPPMLVMAGLGDVPDSVILVTDSRVQRSTDAGATWSPGGPWPLNDPGAGQHPPLITALLGDSSTPERLYAMTKNGGLWTSESGGLAWHVIETPAVAGPVTALAITPYFSIRVWAATQIQLVHSTDTGATWNSHNLPARSPLLPIMARVGRVAALLIDPRNPEIVYAADEGGRVFRSDDSGDHWTDLGSVGGVRVMSLALDPDTRGQLFAATADGIWARRVPPPAPTMLEGVELVPTAGAGVFPGSPLPVRSAEQGTGLAGEMQGRDTATARPSPTSTATETPSPFPTDTATPAPSPSPTASPSATPSPTHAPTHTPTATPQIATPTLPPPPPPTAAPPPRATAPPTAVPTQPPTVPPPAAATATSAPPTIVPPR